MARFYIKEEQIEGNKAYISGEDVNHIKNVLRMKPGDELLVSTGNGLVYKTEIEALDENGISLIITDCDGGRAELPCEITLFQGLPKKDKMELIIQKAVELGAYRIVPVMMKRTVVKLENEKKEEKRLERWRTIALTAAKQSGRDIVPEVADFISFEEAVKEAENLEYKLIPYENEKGMDKAREIVRRAKDKKSIGIFIGPEGGITEEELALAESHGAFSISLGNRILRTETAGLALISVLAFETDR